MGNPFEAIDLRLTGIEQLLEQLHSQIPNLSNEKLEDSIGIKEAARILCLSPNTVYTKTHKRLIPHSKQGKLLIFSRKELYDFIAKGKVKTIQEEIEESETYRAKMLSRR